MNTLSACHILVTRPEPLASRWADQLRSVGAQVTVQTVMTIEPLVSDVAKQAIVNRVLALDEYDGAIFISQNAVEHAFPWLDRYWPQLPQGIKFFAIGKKTAEVLISHTSDLGIYEAADAMNSEALLEHPQLQSIHEKKLIIFKGQGGRDYLEQQLNLRGATVHICELYQRQPVRPTTLDSDFRNTPRQAVISVHSGETLDNLCALLNGDDLSWLQQQLILLPGKRVEALARNAGFKQCVVAENATHESMVEALKKVLNEKAYE